MCSFSLTERAIRIVSPLIINRPSVCYYTPLFSIVNHYLMRLYIKSCKIVLFGWEYERGVRPPSYSHHRGGLEGPSAPPNLPDGGLSSRFDISGRVLAEYPEEWWSEREE